MIAPVCDPFLAAPAAPAPNQRHPLPASAPFATAGNCRGNIFGQNGNLALPLLATFAAHNTKRQVADPRQPASIPALRASLPRHNLKYGKNGNVDLNGQLLASLPAAFLRVLCGSSRPLLPIRLRLQLEQLRVAPAQQI